MNAVPALPTRQRGAALLLLLVVFIGGAAVLGGAALRKAAAREPTLNEQARALALAADALRGSAFQQRCMNPALPADQLLPCPDAGSTEGHAAALCPGLSRGWLPWRTLNMPPLRDASGTCLWYEREGSTARVIAAGAPGATQTRSSLGTRPICGGNNSATQYLDAGDATVIVNLNLAAMSARCP